MIQPFEGSCLTLQAAVNFHAFHLSKSSITALLYSILYSGKIDAGSAGQHWLSCNAEMPARQSWAMERGVCHLHDNSPPV